MEKDKDKQPYERPTIHRIRMLKGELAVAGCKTISSMMGPATGCSISKCSSTTS